MSTIGVISGLGAETFENFRIKVVSDGIGVSGISGNVFIQGGNHLFTTDGDGFTQEFFVDESGSLVITGEIPLSSGFGRTVINQELTIPFYTLEVELEQIISYSIPKGQPLRFVNQNGSKGINNRLLSDMDLGGERPTQNICYPIPRIKTRDEYFTITSEVTNNILQILDNDGNQIGNNIDFVNVRGNTYQVNFNYSVLGLANGFYKLKIVVGNSIDLVSEPIELISDIGHYGLIEYTNDNDRDGIVFTLDPKPQYYIIAPFDLLHEISEEDPITFVNDRNESTLLYDEVSELKRLKTNKEIPFYLQVNIQIALGYDDVKVNGDSFIKTEQGSIEPFEDISHLFNYEVLLRRKEFESQNFN